MKKLISLIFNLFEPNKELKTSNEAEVTTSIIEKKDLREAICPYCKKGLKKIPSRKTKCTNCGESIFVRSSPERIKILCTEEQAKEIDKQWNDIYEVDEKPSKAGERWQDEAWGRLNKETLDHTKNGNWRQFREARLSMAYILDGDKKYKNALRFYFEVVFFDLNGVNDKFGSYDAIINERPLKMFDIAQSSEPLFIAEINNIVNELGLSLDQLKSVFFESCGWIEKFNTPIKLDEAWNIIEEKLQMKD